MHVRKLLGAGCALATLAAMGPWAPAAAGKAGPGVCDGVRRCHQVAEVDVDGDGTADPVGIARRGKDGAPHGKVIVRVKVGDTIVSTRRTTSYWYGSPWQGAATLDGEPGKDLMVGYTAGAHTLFFRALTWREGKLANLDAPGRGRTWTIDGAVNSVYGWLRRGSWPEGTIRRRVADRYETKQFTGTVTSFRWTNGGWEKVETKKFRRMSQDKAYSWSGFHVPGLDEW